MKWWIIMRISVKGRYGLAAMIYIAQYYDSGDNITVLSISDKLGVSKIYLEQVFSLLKRGGLVNSLKGAQGGYMLSRPPKQISAYDILLSTELALFENVEETVYQKAPEIDDAMHTLVYNPIDESVKAVLQKITLYDLVHETNNNKHEPMFFI
jgi:Rrf2 family transcriptional regulator, cysteine metabolism repressor